MLKRLILNAYILLIFPNKILLCHISLNNETTYVVFIRFVASNEEYENHIADLKTNIVENEEEIKELKKELKMYKDIPNKGSCCQIAVEEVSALQEKKIAEITTLLHNEKKNVKDLEDKLMNMVDTNQELNNNFHVKQTMICIY